MTFDPLLSQAMLYGNFLTFGIIQFLGAKLDSRFKPFAYVITASMATFALYYALKSNSEISMILKALGSSTFVTAAIDFYKNDMAGTPPPVPDPAQIAAQ